MSDQKKKSLFEKGRGAASPYHLKGYKINNQIGVRVIRKNKVEKLLEHERNFWHVSFVSDTYPCCENLCASQTVVGPLPVTFLGMCLQKLHFF